MTQVYGEDGVCGHCDICGAPCDESGCTDDRTHVIANPDDASTLPIIDLDAPETVGRLEDDEDPERWDGMS